MDHQKVRTPVPEREHEAQTGNHAEDLDPHGVFGGTAQIAPGVEHFRVVGSVLMALLYSIPRSLSWAVRRQIGIGFDDFRKPNQRSETDQGGDRFRPKESRPERERAA